MRGLGVVNGLAMVEAAQAGREAAETSNSATPAQGGGRPQKKLEAVLR